MKKQHLNGDPVREAELTNRGINFAFYDRVGNSLSSLPFLADFSEAWAARSTMDSEPLFCAMASTGMFKGLGSRLRKNQSVGSRNLGSAVLTIPVQTSL